MKLLLKQISSVYHDLQWVFAGTKFLAAKLRSLYIKESESESEILEISELESDILTPTAQPWMPYLNDGLY